MTAFFISNLKKSKFNNTNILNLGLKNIISLQQIFQQQRPN